MKSLNAVVYERERERKTNELKSLYRNYANECLILLIGWYYKQIKSFFLFSFLFFFIRLKKTTNLTGIPFNFFLGDSRSCAGCVIRLQMTNLVCLVILSLVLSRRTASESEITWSIYIIKDLFLYLNLSKYKSSVRQHSYTK